MSLRGELRQCAAYVGNIPLASFSGLFRLRCQKTPLQPSPAISARQMCLGRAGRGRPFGGQEEVACSISQPSLTRPSNAEISVRLLPTSQACWIRKPCHGRMGSKSPFAVRTGGVDMRRHFLHCHFDVGRRNYKDPWVCPLYA